MKSNSTFQGAVLLRLGQCWQSSFRARKDREDPLRWAGNVELGKQRPMVLVIELVIVARDASKMIVTRTDGSWELPSTA